MLTYLDICIWNQAALREMDRHQTRHISDSTSDSSATWISFS